MANTIKDIAAAARVSVATVSLALNNKPGISSNTRRKVLEIAKSLYPEIVQKKLHSIRTGSVRFLKIIKHGHVLNRDHDVFISSYIDGLELEARNNGFNLEVNTYRASDMDEIVDQIIKSSLDGIIVLGTELNEHDLKQFEVVKKPIGILDTSYNFIKFDFVDMNNEESIFQIVDHFIQNGHLEIGHITSPVEVRNFELRREAFRRALQYFNIPFQKQFIFSVDSTFEGAYQDMSRILKRGPKIPAALCTANDIIAYGCIKAIKEHGYGVPEDFSVIGFDNLPLCAVMDPPLTTMNVSKKQIGKMAMRMIISRINHDLGAPAVKISISGDLIQRRSVKQKTA
jgi:LacI family transcriptional regulator